MMKQNECERLLTEDMDSLWIQMDQDMKENGWKLMMMDKLECNINMEKEIINMKMA